MLARLLAVFPRRGLSIVAACVAAASVTAHARPQHPSVSLGSPPGWVLSTTAGTSQPYDPATQTDGLEHLLLDDQVRTGFGPREIYHRYVYRVVDEKGLRDRSQIEIEFDPSYETVTLHKLALRRGDVESSRLSESSFRVIEREPGFEAQMYDERLSIISILDDVRIGDQIEVAYTRRGDNPVFSGRYATTVGLAWTVPVRRMSHRVLLRKEQRLELRTFETQLSPTIAETSDAQERRIDLVDVPALISESSTPFWFDPYPRLEYSEYSSWAEVARWGAQQFVTPSELSPRLRESIAALETSSPPDERVIAALSFVRDEIRYLSKSLGPSSHRPASPDTVLERRFGDCKDKALLLVTLLEGLGFQARAALVSTGLREHVAERLPSPLAFDHVIVRVVSNGRTYWLDPTSLHSRGTLDRRTCPRYGTTLVLDSDTTALTAITPPAIDVPRIAVRTEIEASNRASDASMKVATTYSFGAADSIRAGFAESGRDEMEKGNLNFYAPAYPSIRSDAPLEVRDDEARNEILTTERYVIPSFWNPADENGWILGTVEAREIAALVSIPAVTGRTMPLGISHPTNWDLQITARLGEDCSELSPVHENIETDGLRFSCDIVPTRSTLELHYTFESRRDSVRPEKALEHVEALDRIYETTSYSVQMPVQATEPGWRPNWTVLIFAVMSLLVATVVSTALYFYRPKAAASPAELDAAAPHGIGGWLILVAIGIVLRPVGFLFTLIGSVSTYELSAWSDLTQPASPNHHPLWAPVLLGGLFGNIFFAVFSVLLVVLFFQKRRTFPMLFVVARGAEYAFQALNMLALKYVPEAEHASVAGAVGALIGALLWILYFLRSRRVRATFVN